MTWTTEQVAEHLGITVDEVYTSRRRGDFPGNLGVRRGKRLVFNPEQILNPPKEESTDDVQVAILWELQAHTQLLRRIVNEIRRDFPQSTIVYNALGEPSGGYSVSWAGRGGAGSADTSTIGEEE